jgi:GT2 family glycosyltransferase
MIEISASVVTYKNEPDVLRRTILSFLNTQMKVKLYVIDNSNESYIRELCSDIDENIEYIPMVNNVGFGAGHNVILNNIEKIGLYHLVLNPDVRFEQGVLESLYSYMESQPNIGNIMPRILYPDGSVQYLCKLLPTPMDWIGRLLIPIKRIKKRMNYKFEMQFSGYNNIMEVPYLSGCFMFLRKEAIEKVGVFDEGIFMYGEDTDLNRRIGHFYKTVFYPLVSITHDFEKGSHKEMRLLIIHVRAAVYYFNKWGWFIDRERTKINMNVLKKYNL